MPRKEDIKLLGRKITYMSLKKTVNPSEEDEYGCYGDDIEDDEDQ